MSFFNRMLASIGIGSATVDTRLEKEQFRPGDEVRGAVFIQGGNVEQAINNIYIQVLTQYIKEHDDQKTTYTHVMERCKVADSLKVQPNEKLEIPFSFRLPLETPLTIGRHPVWLRTGLDVEMAVDPSDNDYIQVLPHPHVETVLEAAGDLGFQLKSAQCEYYSRRGYHLPFVQEFEFYPGSSFAGRMRELELVFFPNSNGVDVIIEVDRRARGLLGFLEESFDLNERKQVLRLSTAELEKGASTVARRLAESIDYQTR